MRLSLQCEIGRQLALQCKGVGADRAEGAATAEKETEKCRPCASAQAANT